MDVVTLLGLGCMAVVFLIVAGILVSRLNSQRENQKTKVNTTEQTPAEELHPTQESRSSIPMNEDLHPLQMQPLTYQATVSSVQNIPPNTLSIIIIVLLVIMALFWLMIGFMQLGCSGLSLAGLSIDPTLSDSLDPETQTTLLNSSVSSVFCGIWNILISIVNLYLIRDVVKRKKRIVSELLFLGIAGSLFGAVQLFSGALLQVCAIPLYIILAVLGQINKTEYVNQ